MKELFLIEFEYDATVRPCDLGLSVDGRPLAVHFKRVVLTFTSAERSIADFDLAGQFAPGFFPLFGFSALESTGVWSEGRRSCFLLEGPDLPDAECRVTIFHEFLVSPAIGAFVRVNGHSLGHIFFDQSGAVSFAIPPRCRPDALLAAASNNVSLSSAADPAVTVIIPNYNRWDLTAGCIVWLLSAQIGMPHEIIVVDNGSAPTQYAALQAAALPVQIIRLDERRSFGEANNLAVEHARGSKLLFLNNDAFVRSECVARLAEALEQSRVGAAGPVFEDTEGRLQEAGCFINMDGTVLLRDYRYFQAQVELPPLSEVDHISAACLMLKRDLFVGLGGFDLAYDPAYHEDVDLCCKLRATGERVLLVRDARTMHIRNATVNTLPSSDQVLAAPARSHAVFASRWGAWLTTKDPQHAPTKASVHLHNWDTGPAPFPGHGVNAVLFTGRLQRNFNSYAAMAISTAASRLGPALFCTPTSYSMLRFLDLAHEFSLPKTQTATASERSLRRRKVETFIHSTCEMPPELRRYGERQILHCSMPEKAYSLTERERHERVDALSSYEAIVTDSEFAKRKIMAALRDLGSPFLSVSVIPPPISTAEDIYPKENIIVSIGRFRNGPMGGSHDLVLRSFQPWCNSSINKWQLVCVGEVESEDDVLYFRDLSFRAAAWQVRCILAPTPRQRKELYRRAKVCVSASAAHAFADQNQICLHSSLEIREAIAYGCVPVVYARGAEAELCEYLGFESVFDHPEEVKERIALAIAHADIGTLTTASRQRAARWSIERFCEEWERLLSLEARYEGHNSA